MPEHLIDLWEQCPLDGICHHSLVTTVGSDLM